VISYAYEPMTTLFQCNICTVILPVHWTIHCTSHHKVIEYVPYVLVGIGGMKNGMVLRKYLGIIKCNTLTPQIKGIPSATNVM